MLVVDGLIVLANLCLPSMAAGLRRGHGYDTEKDSWDGYHHLERLLREHQMIGKSDKEANQGLRYSSSLSGAGPEQATVAAKFTDDVAATGYENDFSRSIDDTSHTKVRHSLFSRFTEQIGPRQDIVS